MGQIRQFRQRRKAQEREFRARVDAQNLNDVNGLAGLSDAELIATTHAIPSQNHQMELMRRLKVAMTELTGETIAARVSSDRASARIWWLNVLLVLLTAALVALTVVLAIKS